jgi:hypothetical protein
MIINITNKKELENAQEMVDLLGTKLMDKLEIAEFILDDENTLRLVKQDNNTMTPSEVLKEIKDMAELITKNDKADRKMREEKNFDFCLPQEESDLAHSYRSVFTDKYNVFYAEILDTMYRKKMI